MTLPWGVYYCFVAWQSVEQTEAGDTLIHTFEVPDWSYCQIKWLAFRGTVAGELSPSVSPIFKHHHPGMPTILTLYPYQDNGILQDSPTFNAGSFVFFAIGDYPGSIRHGLLSFNTSAIPGSVSILTAILRLKPYARDYLLLGRGLQFCKLKRLDWGEYVSTWINYKHLHPWDTPGGDYFTDDPSPVNIAFTEDQQNLLEVDLCPLLQDAVVNTIPLHLLIRFQDETYYRPNWGFQPKSRENADGPISWPRLTVTYYP